MATPTNHTNASTLFDFGDLLEPEPSEDSLEENSSVEESTMFVSLGGETPRSALPIAATPMNSDDVPSQQQTSEPEAAAATGVVTTAAEAPKGILKTSKYSDGQDTTAKPKVAMVDSMLSLKTDYDESHRPQAFSPTAHTSNVMSPTVHRSNQTPGTQLPKSNKSTKTSISRMDHLEISDQSAEKAAAWAIHFALIFFCLLILTCVLLTFKVVRQYGFLTLVLMAFVLVFCGFLACFVDSTILSQNPKLKPVRQKILTVVQTTKKIIEDEYQLFVNEWKEHHLLLTQHGEGESFGESLMGDDVLPTTTTQKKRKKSKVFKMIKPFLGFKKKIGGKGRRRQKGTTESVPESSYQAPEI